MSSCNCDGTVSQDVSDYFSSLGNLSDLFGGVAPDTQQTIACRNALARLQASGNDCGSDYLGFDLLSQLYQEELGNVSYVASTTPYSNPIQRTVDTTIGGQPSAPVVAAPGTPPKSNNMTFIIGAIAILAIGFILVIR